jgi:hypothetical protein
MLRSLVAACLWWLSAHLISAATRLHPAPIRRVLEVDGAMVVPGIQLISAAPDADELASRRDAQEVWDVLSRRTSWRRSTGRASA